MALIRSDGSAHYRCCPPSPTTRLHNTTVFTCLCAWQRSLRAHLSCACRRLKTSCPANAKWASQAAYRSVSIDDTWSSWQPIDRRQRQVNRPVTVVVYEWHRSSEQIATDVNAINNRAFVAVCTKDRRCRWQGAVSHFGRLHPSFLTLCCSGRCSARNTYIRFCISKRRRDVAKSRY